MRRRPGILAAGLLALSLAGLSAGAGAQAPGASDAPPPPPGRWRPGPPGGPPGPPFSDVLERHADELGLDADTLARIHAIAEKARVAEQPLAEQLRSLHDAMRTMLQADSPKVDDVMQQADRIGALETELRKARLSTMLEIRSLLTADQRQKLVQLFEAKKQRWRERRGDATGEPGGPVPPPSPPPQ
ncbi:MAG TPA: periplasmic heavy metal sensor [Myxococcota bacterium]|nr:periplasmic heavy metal sensor [Myxococcota bacterium]